MAEPIYQGPAQEVLKYFHLTKGKSSSSACLMDYLSCLPVEQMGSTRYSVHNSVRASRAGTSLSSLPEDHPEGKTAYEMNNLSPKKSAEIWNYTGAAAEIARVVLRLAFA